MISNKIKNKIRGFTLIELLVVIAIIGLLATLLLANLNATRSRARDARRKSDLRNIQTALRIYYNDYDQSFPDNSGNQIAGCGLGGTSSCAWGGEWTAGTHTYMNILPGDPDPGRTYIYTQNDSDDYTLSACLENPSDDSCNTTNSHTGCAADDGCTYLVNP